LEPKNVSHKIFFKLFVHTVFTTKTLLLTYLTMCICITLENESLRCLERSKVEKDTTAVSFSIGSGAETAAAAGMDFCFEKDLMDWTAVHFDEVMIDACAKESSSDCMDWTAVHFDEVMGEACAEESSSEIMDWTAIQFDEVVEMEWMEVHFDEEMEFEVEEDEEVEMEDQEIVMDFEFD
jgi:hypothetical protein